ncbi:RNase adapter RapZ [Candidatus Desantisbacteria bacterium]|nr:RNase adapter RapZ [Candidatus Desantisbacteria bacterium]
MKLVIITGLSGAGKSEVIKVFEDMGYFCITNLPVMLIDKFMTICAEIDKPIDKVALGIDIRERELLDNFCNVLENLEQVGFHYDIIFLEAEDKAIIRRYSATRRKHPLGEEGTIVDNVNKEKKMLSSIREKATMVIDTSELTLNDLKNLLITKFASRENASKMLIRLYAFGYKYGIPLDADLVFDVRFLPNPQYLESMKALTGKSEDVKKYVLGAQITKIFLDKLYSLLDFLLPKYLSENKAYLTIAIGCTGGKHRSVTIIDELAEYCKSNDYVVKTIYRDIERE